MDDSKGIGKAGDLLPVRTDENNPAWKNEWMRKRGPQKRPILRRG